MSAEENLQRMKTLDDAWNAQNWDVFRKRHSADTKVYWPGQPDPTHGRDAHHRESEAFFKSIENHLDKQEAVQPRQQHKADAPADIRDTCIPTPHADHPHEGQGSQDGAKADERRTDTGHDRDRARRAMARSIPPKITACTGSSAYQ